MRAIMVAVDYTDMLAVTLPYNVHHFEEVFVVTDLSTNDVQIGTVCDDNGAHLLTTDLFYADGAVFNKWAALEWGLDQMGRHGWIALMDADVLLPKDIQFIESAGCLMMTVPHGTGRSGIGVDIGQLCTPLRRMWSSWPHCPTPIRSTDIMLGGHRYPGESSWKDFPVHRNVAEWAGYSQIFHAEDPHLGPAPWHQVDWEHCGGADSLFQDKWPRECKVRPPFEVLHLGPAGQNWYGRATRRLDGSLPQESAERLQRVAQIWTGRRELERQGAKGEGRYVREKLPPRDGPAPGG